MTFTQYQQFNEGYNYNINDVFLNRSTNELLINYINDFRHERDCYIRGMVSAAIMILRTRKERVVEIEAN